MSYTSSQSQPKPRPPNRRSTRVTCLRCGFAHWRDGLGQCGCSQLSKVEAYVADRGMYGGYPLGHVYHCGVRLFYDDGRAWVG